MNAYENKNDIKCEFFESIKENITRGSTERARETAF